MRRAAAFFGVIALAITSVVIGSASTAGAVTDPIDIEVDHVFGTLHRVLSVSGVTAGPGPEVTAADETQNDGLAGNVLVDVDPVAQTITVEVESGDACYDDIEVTITSAEIVSIVHDSGTVFGDEGPFTRTEDVSAGVTTILWDSPNDQNCNKLLATVGSQAVFSYQVSNPTMTVDPASGVPGDAIEVAGTECEGDEVTVTVTLDSADVATEVATVGGDGSWSVDIDTTGYAVGIYDVDATCSILQDPIFDYDTEQFTLTAAPTTTSTTTTSTTAPPENVSDNQTPAAQPTVASPTFTG